MLYSRKYTPSHCFFFKFCWFVCFLCTLTSPHKSWANLFTSSFSCFKSSSERPLLFSNFKTGGLEKKKYNNYYLVYFYFTNFYTGLCLQYCYQWESCLRWETPTTETYDNWQQEAILSTVSCRGLEPRTSRLRVEHLSHSFTALQCFI